MFELLIAAAGFSVVGAVVIVVMMTMYNALQILRAKTMVSDTLRNAMERVGRDAQAAKGALSTTCGFYTPSSTTLILDKPDGSRVIYRCGGSQLCNGEDPANPGTLDRMDANALCVPSTPVSSRTVARGVTALNFNTAQDGNRRVEVALSIRQRSASYTYTAQLTGAFRWRGH